MRESVGQAKSLAMNFFWQRGGGDFEGKLVLAPQKQKTALWAGSLNSPLNFHRCVLLSLRRQRIVAFPGAVGDGDHQR